MPGKERVTKSKRNVKTEINIAAKKSNAKKKLDKIPNLKGGAYKDAHAQKALKKTEQCVLQNDEKRNNYTDTQQTILKKETEKEKKKQYWKRLFESTKRGMAIGARHISKIITWPRNENWRRKDKHNKK